MAAWDSVEQQQYDHGYYNMESFVAVIGPYVDLGRAEQAAGKPRRIVRENPPTAADWAAASVSGPPAPSSPAPSPSSSAAPLVVEWSLASIVLSGAIDPYNKAISEAFIERNQDHGFEADEGTTTVYKTIQGIVGSAPVVGQIVLIVYKLWELLGDWIGPDSHGGWDDLTPLARQRGALYAVIPRPEFLRLARPYPSQVIDFSAPERRPQRWLTGSGFPMRNPNYAAEYKAWLRRYLQEQAYAVEFFRITQAADEPMLPKIVMELLFQAKAWPPPLEPMPLTTEAFRARYEGTANPAQRYPYYEGLGYLNAQIVDSRTTQAEQLEDEQLSEAVSFELWAQYAQDAASYWARIERIKMPDELRELALNSGCVPRLGSLANGAPAAPARRRGIPGRL